jgi:hypothetical protein
VAQEEKKNRKKTIFFNTEVNDFSGIKRAEVYGVYVYVCVCVCVRARVGVGVGGWADGWMGRG